MSDPAAPWWAEVQHLRPSEDAVPASPAPRTPSRRFPRERQVEQEAALATLEHEVADPFAPSPWADESPWAEPAADRPRHRGTTDEWTIDEPATDEPTWDPAIEQAFAQAPSWSDDDAWLLPKGADRIENGRRTIEIRGQVDRIHGFNAAPEPQSMAQRARGRRPGERFERRPDRVAMWAFLLGVLLILIAALSQPGDADAAAAAVDVLARM